ncbi:tannase/feruloyl esterase family alpha/beta hydrolase [Altererythrobacter indicus]|uniref:Tannase/feruloyl esterase family alpha/beta hydrolase n=1 Tax=Altericroceibacterium indicum TaxID=374177 RepID=A0A845A8M6_9SPHN|nr:tannase/feruloyl esterase family alpha/beta hydrolase [Altericroceibacterium indicum]MXP26722.1 tannase/feruloyl esterase family alpha/beta hydrolase [Altericroceibacterium indicum]
MTRHSFFNCAASVLGLSALAACATGAPQAPETQVASSQVGPAARCTALGEMMASHWPDAGTKLSDATYHEAGPFSIPARIPGAPSTTLNLPAHCELTGITHERKGVDGQDYAIRFHVRLPEKWNGRFLFEGGGGTNGELGMAIGMVGFGKPTALQEGYAILSQDSGHSNAINTVPDKGGPTAFGFDPQARADYGGESLKTSTLAAKALIKTYYGADPRYSYFFGCSKGGEEGMALAQRYPTLYDGIVAAAPGFSLPRAAIAEAWNTQAYAGILKAENKPLTVANLASTFSDGDMALVRQSILEACDANDGLTDGLVGAYHQCTSPKVIQHLKAHSCKGDKADGCLSTAQIDALEKVHQGPRTSKGEQIYPGLPWDAGWGDAGWRIWHIGSSDGRVPSINVAMGAPSLSIMFSTPPKVPGVGLDGYLAYQVNYDFDRDPAKIYATNAEFKQSAWDLMSARSSNLAAFRARGGKLIVPHGLSDPVFSIADTMAWWNEVNQANNGTAAEFTRVFPVPGMGHCQGGPATDNYDSFGALVNWVEKGKAPDKLIGTAGPASPWPGRTRPICPYPLEAQANPGAQSNDPAASFTCKAKSE